MPYKFERLDIWNLALEYVDQVYALVEQLPRSEEFNLKSQFTRAATSVALNIAEGSTGQSDAEQARFLGLALRSLVETVACQHLAMRRNYFPIAEPVRDAYRSSESLFIKIQAMRNTLRADRIAEASAGYEVEGGTPF